MGGIKKISVKKFTWIDALNPSSRDLAALKSKYHLDQVDVDNAGSCKYSQCPRTILRSNYIFLAVVFPNLNNRTGEVIEEEVGVFLSYEYLITVHVVKIEEISVAFKELRDNPGLISQRYGDTPLYFFYDLLARLYHRIYPLLDKIGKNLKSIEKGLLNGEFERNIHEIFKIKSSILSFKRILQGHRIAINKLTVMITKYFGSKKFVKSYLTELLGHISDNGEVLHTYGELIESFENSSNSMIYHQDIKIDHQTNKIIKTLMVLTVLPYPLMTIAALFSTNVEHMPIIGSPYDFWILLSIITGLTVLMWVVLKKKGWV